jgi:hypothetical protein
VSGHAGDRLVSPADLISNLAGAGKVEFLVRVGVIANLLSCQGYHCGRGWISLDVLTDHEERCRGALTLECLENALGHTRVRTIVERQVGDAFRGSSPDDRSEDPAIRRIGSPNSRAEHKACTGSTEF